MLSQRVRYVTLLAAGLLLPMQPFVFGLASVSNLQSEFRPSAVAVDSGPVGSSDPIEQDETQSTTDNTPITPPAFPSAVPSTEMTDSTPPSRIRSLRGEKVWSTATSPDGRFVVRTTTARRVVLTDLMSNNETDLSKERITAVAFAPEGDWFAAADQNGRVTIWDSSRGNLLRVIRTHTDALRSLAVSPGGQTIAAAGRDGTVLLIDSITGESRADVPSYSSAVNCVRFSADGRQLAVAVGDWRSNGRGEVSLLNAVTGKSEVTLRCPTTPGALTFASNEELIVGLWDGRTQLWNLVNRQVVGTALADKSVVSAAAFSPDNPALREAIFIAEVPNHTGEPSPLSFIHGLFAAPAK